MNTDGFNSSTFFQDGVITDLIEDESKISAIELDDTTINFDSFNLKHNGITIPTGSSSVSNPMIAPLDAATYNIVNVNQLTTDSIASTDLTRFIDFNTPALINITATTLKHNTRNILTTPLQEDVDCNLKILSNCNGLNTSRIRPLTTNDMEILVNPTYITLQSNILAGNITAQAGGGSGTLDLSGFNLNLGATNLYYNSVLSVIPKIQNTSTININSASAGGTNSIILGIDAGLASTSTSNILIGRNAYKAGTSFENVYLGYNSGPLSGGQGATVIGANSLPSGTTDATFSTIIGSSAGLNITTTSIADIFIGRASGLATAGASSYNTCIGHFAKLPAGSSYSIALGAAVTGENNCFTHACTRLQSITDNYCDLGASTRRYKDLYLSGTINEITPVGGVWMQLGAATTITATTTETNLIAGITNLGSLTVAANKFTASAYQLILYGNFGSANGNTITFRFKFGAVVFSIVPNLTGTSGEHFELEIDYTISSIGGVGVASITQNLEFSYSDTGSSSFLGDRSVSTDNTNFDTTISNTLQITAQFSTNSANNTIQCLRGVLRKMY